MLGVLVVPDIMGAGGSGATGYIEGSGGDRLARCERRRTCQGAPWTPQSGGLPVGPRPGRAVRVGVVGWADVGLGDGRSGDMGGKLS